MRRVLRWATDWRNGATVLCSVLVALLVLSYVDGVHARDDAFEQLSLSRSAASRRIDKLTERIGDLELRGEANGALIGSLRSQVEALVEQVRQMGGDPVVIIREDGSTSGGGSSTGPTSSTTTTTTTAPPPPAPEPDPEPEPDPALVCRIPILRPCGGSRR